MLVKLKVKFVLAEPMNNDPIEHRFSLIRYLSGNHLALNVPTFLHNEWMLLLKLVVQLCVNTDGSHNKNLHKSFFDYAHSMIEQSEKLEIAFFQNRWHELGNTCSNSTGTNEILTNLFVPCIAGCRL